MKFSLFLVALTIHVCNLSAQVTIGSDNKPAVFSTLQLDGVVGGLRLNQLNNIQRDALLVTGNNLAIGLMIYNVDQEQIEVWNGSTWISLGQGSGGQGGEVFAANGLTKYADSLTLGGILDRSTNINVDKHQLNITSNLTPMLSVTNANVGIGTNTPASNAILDVSASNKGVLLPRITLTSNTDQLTIPAPSIGMLVYNTGANAAYPFDGYLYWNGVEWRRIDGSETLTPKITKFNCVAGTIEPKTFTSGVPYTGVMRIPYEGGNGAKYGAAAAIAPIVSSTIQGLTAKLRGGVLEQGNGFLIYDVSGTPSASSPLTVRFLIQFGGLQCVPVNIGNAESETATVTSWATMGPLVATADNGANGFHRVATSPDGNFSVRVFVHPGTTLANADLQVRTNTTATSIMWNGHYAFAGGASAYATNDLNLALTNMWYGSSGSSSTAVAVSSNINAAWGDPDVYYLAPEQRSYMWTSTDVNDRTMYVLSFMMGAPLATAAANSTTAAQTKAYLEIRQIKTPK